jgi:hypothetical protein
MQYNELEVVESQHLHLWNVLTWRECSDVGQGPVENHLLEWNNPSGVPIIIIEGITNPMDLSAVFEEDCGD